MGSLHRHRQADNAPTALAPTALAPDLAPALAPTVADDIPLQPWQVLIDGQRAFPDLFLTYDEEERQPEREPPIDLQRDARTQLAIENPAVKPAFSSTCARAALTGAM